MVQLALDADVDAIAAAAGQQVLAPAGLGQIAVLGFDADRSSTGDVLARLRGLPGIVGASPHARVQGAGKRSSSSTETSTTTTPSTPDYSALQWHLDAIGGRSTSPGDLSAVVVAVIDSGVAYTKAPSLSSSRIVAPKDFIDGDTQPYDEHQHGTHIASLIASKGGVKGVAPGVALMPIRVLDANNQGTEYGLVQGIHHAVDNGAMVINLSLAFGADYVPSRALREALQRAADADIVLVGAAGNVAADRVSWPAASPLVFAVGASSHSGAGSAYQGLDVGTVAPYASVGMGMDLMAPGGDLTVDRNADGYPDGLLAETIAAGDPSKVGYAYLSGSSQAAALVTGSVAVLLSKQVKAKDVPTLLHQSAWSWDGKVNTYMRDYGASFDAGTGAGSLNLGTAAMRAGVGVVYDRPEVYTSMLPWLERSGDGRSLRPHTRVSVADSKGKAFPMGASISASIWSTRGTEWATCDVAPGQSSCDLVGSWVTDNKSAPTAYATSIDGVQQFSDIFGGLVAMRPRAAFVASDAFELLVAGIWEEELDDRLLALRWDEATDADMGRVAASYSVLDFGSGLATSPMGVVLTPKALGKSSVQTVSADLDGSGLATSPMGFARLSTFTLDGSGLATSPMGMVPLRFVAIDGLGLATSPMGFRGTELVKITASSWNDPAILMDGTVVNLATGASLTSNIQGTHVGEWFSGAGLVNEAGVPAASALVGSGYSGAAQ